MEQTCGNCVFCNRAESESEAEWGITRYECSYYMCDVSYYRQACDNYEYNYDEY